MIIPSQIRSEEALKVERDDDGVFSFVNAYEGDRQEFFPGRLTPIRPPEVPPYTPHPSNVAGQGARQDMDDTAARLPQHLTSGPVEELRAQIRRQLLEELDPDKEADVRDVEEVYEWLKRTGSQCVSQIVVETGLPRRRILLAIRQLFVEGLIEWLPDNKCDNVQLVETAWAIRRVIDRRSGKVETPKAA